MKTETQVLKSIAKSGRLKRLKTELHKSKSELERVSARNDLLEGIVEAYRLRNLMDKGNRSWYQFWR